MGDLSLILSVKHNANINELENYFLNYQSTVDLVKKEDDNRPELVNLFRLFYLFIDCNNIERVYGIPLARGTVFSNVNRSHFQNEKFKQLLKCENSKLIGYLNKYIRKEVKSLKLFEMKEVVSADIALKAWLTLKVYNANKEKLALSFYDGNKTGIDLYANIHDERNKLIKTEPLNLENLICGFGINAGGGLSSYIRYAAENIWLDASILDTPFAGVSHNPELRTKEQLEINRIKIEYIVNYIKEGPTD